MVMNSTEFGKMALDNQVNLNGYSQNSTFVNSNENEGDVVVVDNSDHHHIRNHVIIHLTNTDVIFGRGKRFDLHNGNACFRGLVMEWKDEYLNSDRLTKRRIIRCIINEVLAKGGRFLKEVDSTVAKRWMIAEDKEVVKKVMQILRPDYKPDRQTLAVKNLKNVNNVNDAFFWMQAKPSNATQNNGSCLIGEEEVIEKESYDICPLLFHARPPCGVALQSRDCLAASHQMPSPVAKNAVDFSDVSFRWVPEIDSDTGELIAPTFHELTCLTKNAFTTYTSSNKSDKLTNDLLLDALWALTHATDDYDDIQTADSDAFVASIMMSVLRESDSEFFIPAVRTIVNLVSGNSLQIQAVFDAGFLDLAELLLGHAKKRVRMETCNLLSYTPFATQSQIEALFDRKQVIATLVDAVTSGSWDVRKRALLSLAKIVKCGSTTHILSLVQDDVLTALCCLFHCGLESEITAASLKAIEKILTIGEQYHCDYSLAITNCGGLDKLYNLQEHADDAIYQLALHIIESFFIIDDTDIVNIAPAVNGNVYSFGVSVPVNIEWL